MSNLFALFSRRASTYQPNAEDLQPADEAEQAFQVDSGSHAAAVRVGDRSGLRVQQQRGRGLAGLAELLAVSQVEPATGRSPHRHPVSAEQYRDAVCELKNACQQWLCSELAEGAASVQQVGRKQSETLQALKQIFSDRSTAHGAPRQCGQNILGLLAAARQASTWTMSRSSRSRIRDLACSVW